MTGLLIGGAAVIGLLLLMKRKAPALPSAQMPVQPPLVSVEPAPAPVAAPKPSAAQQFIDLAKQTLASGGKLTPEQQAKLQTALKLVG